MYNVYIEVASLVYILCICRFKSNIFPCGLFVCLPVCFVPLLGFTNNFAQMSSMMSQCAVHRCAVHV